MKCPTGFKRSSGLCVKRGKEGRKIVHSEATLNMRENWGDWNQVAKERFVDHLSGSQALGSHDGNVDYKTDGDRSTSSNEVYLDVELSYPSSYTLKEIKDTVEIDTREVVADTLEYQMSSEESRIVEDYKVEK
jgi:hypothetical protein